MADKRRIIKTVATHYPVGKTKLRVFVDGCVTCGDEYSEDPWQIVGAAVLLIAGKRRLIDLCQCSDCFKGRDVVGKFAVLEEEETQQKPLDFD